MPKPPKASDKKSAAPKAKAGAKAPPPKAAAKSPAKSAKVAKPSAAKPAATAKGKPAPKPAAAKAPIAIPLPGLGVSSSGIALPGLGATSSTAIPGFKAPPKAEPKAQLQHAPGKAFDPKSEDWRNRHGKGQAGSGAPPNRPFKGGARGR